jgi:hypothetical protein
MTTFASVTTGLPPATFLKPSCCRSPMSFRRIFSRFEKLDVMFIGFIHFALITEVLRFLC